MLWLEPFVWLSDTRTSRSGIDQFRSFAGITVPVANGVEIETGYLNQYLNSATGDRSNHAVVLNVGYRF